MSHSYILDSFYKRVINRRIILVIFGDGVWISYAVFLYIAKRDVDLLWYLLLFSILFIIWTAAIILSVFIFVSYKLTINGDKLEIISKTNVLIRRLDLCTIRFPLINLKEEWREKFLRENRKVHLLFRDNKGSRPVIIGKSFMGLGMIPMYEAMEVESWVKQQKEKICLRYKK